MDKSAQFLRGIFETSNPIPTVVNTHRCTAKQGFHMYYTDLCCFQKTLQSWPLTVGNRIVCTSCG